MKGCQNKGKGLAVLGETGKLCCMWTTSSRDTLVCSGSELLLLLLIFIWLSRWRCAGPQPSPVSELEWWASHASSINSQRAWSASPLIQSLMLIRNGCSIFHGKNTNQNTRFHFSCMHKTGGALHFQHYTVVNMFITHAMVLLMALLEQRSLCTLVWPMQWVWVGSAPTLCATGSPHSSAGLMLHPLTQLFFRGFCTFCWHQMADCQIG